MVCDDIYSVLNDNVCNYGHAKFNILSTVCIFVRPLGVLEHLVGYDIYDRVVCVAYRGYHRQNCM